MPLKNNQNRIRYRLLADILYLVFLRELRQGQGVTSLYVTYLFAVPIFYTHLLGKAILGVNFRRLQDYKEYFTGKV